MFHENQEKMWNLVKKKEEVISLICIALVLITLAILPLSYQITKKTIFSDSDFYIIFFLILLLSIAYLLKKRTRIIKLNRIHALIFVGLILGLLINIIFYTNKDIKNIAEWFMSIVLFFYARQIFSTRRLADIFFYSLILLSFIWSIIAIVQFLNNNFTPGLPINGAFSNSGFFGNYLLSIYPYTLAHLSIYKRQCNNSINKRMVFFAIVLLSIIGFSAIILTMARAAYIGLFISLLYLSVAAINKRMRKKYLIYTLSLITLATPYFIYLIATSFKRNSAYGRIQIWKIGYKMLKENFPIGLGIGQVYTHFNNYQAKYFLSSSHSLNEQLLAYNTFEVFNSFLQIGIELGLLGILIYIVALFCVYKIGLKIIKKQEDSPVYIGAYLSLLTLFTSSLFSNPFHHLPILFVSICSVSILSIQKEKYYMLFKSRVLLISISLILLCLSPLFIIRLTNQLQWREAANLAISGNFLAADSLYKNCYDFLSTDRAFLYNYGCELCIAERYKESILILRRATAYYNSSDLFTYLGIAYEGINDTENSIKSYQYAIAIMPSALYPRYKLFNQYILIKDTSNVIRTGKEITILPIKIINPDALEIKRIVEQKLSSYKKNKASF